MYISRFPKSDREDIVRHNQKALQMVEYYNSIEEKIQKYNYKFVLNNVEKIRQGELEKKYLRTTIQTFIHLTANDVKQKGILERIINNDLEKQVSGIYTSGRLWYIHYATKELIVDGADCLHVYKIIDALSIRDFELVDKYLIILPGPAKHGHRFSKLICNGLYSILHSIKNGSLT
jgi:hypothetical protein